MPPVVIAAYHGYHLVLRVFKLRFLDHGLPVEFSATDDVRKETVLHTVLKAESKAYSNREQRDYGKCLKLLLDDEDKTFQQNLAEAVNAQDNMGNTPLHIAAQVNIKVKTIEYCSQGDSKINTIKSNCCLQMGNHEAVRKLLRSEANLGLKIFFLSLSILNFDLKNF